MVKYSSCFMSLQISCSVRDSADSTWARTEAFYKVNRSKLSLTHLENKTKQTAREFFRMQENWIVHAVAKCSNSVNETHQSVATLKYQQAITGCIIIKLRNILFVWIKGGDSLDYHYAPFRKCIQVLQYFACEWWNIPLMLGPWN